MPSMNLATFWGHNKNTLTGVLNLLEMMLPAFAHSPEQAAALSGAVQGVNAAVNDLHSTVSAMGNPDLGAGIKGSDVLKAVLVAEIPNIAMAVAERLAPHMPSAPVPPPPPEAAAPPSEAPNPVQAPAPEPVQGVLPEVATSAPAPAPTSEDLAAAMAEPPTDNTQVGAPPTPGS